MAVLKEILWFHWATMVWHWVIYQPNTLVRSLILLFWAFGACRTAGISPKVTKHEAYKKMTGDNRTPKALVLKATQELEKILDNPKAVLQCQDKRRPRYLISIKGLELEDLEERIERWSRLQDNKEFLKYETRRITDHHGRNQKKLAPYSWEGRIFRTNYKALTRPKKSVSNLKSVRSIRLATNMI